MADAINFPGSNFTFSAPPDRDDVRDLQTFRQPDGPCNVSCWQLRPEELDEVNRTGCVFLSVMSGFSFYPAFVGAESVVRGVVVDYGKVWDRGPYPPAPVAAGGLRAPCSRRASPRSRTRPSSKRNGRSGPIAGARRECRQPAFADMSCHPKRYSARSQRCPRSSARIWTPRCAGAG